VVPLITFVPVGVKFAARDISRGATSRLAKVLLSTTGPETPFSRIPQVSFENVQFDSVGAACWSPPRMWHTG